MGEHSSCVIDICHKNMQYPELYKKHSNVDGDIILQKLSKDRAVKTAWVNTRFKRRKNLSQESLHTFITTSLFGWLINLSPVFYNKMNPSPDADCFSESKSNIP